MLSGKYIKYIVAGFFILLGWSGSIHAKNVVIVDAGHGGDEYGAQARLKNGSWLYEKDLTLTIAKKIVKELKGKTDVFLSRSLDRTLTLQERAKQVEKLGANLFISVHMNSSEDQTSHGFETYYLDNKNDAAVKKVVDTENAKSDLPEEIQLILTDLVVGHTVMDSKTLANQIHINLDQSLSQKFNMKNRGVKRGLFYVLALSKVPGVLLECGFISNEGDRKKLLDPKFQDQYAKAVAKGVMDFISSRVPAKK